MRYCFGILIFLGIFGASFVEAQQPNWLWATSGGGKGNDQVSSIAADSFGNSYICGYFQDSAIFSGTMVQSAKGYHLFLAKYDSDGTLQWVKTTGKKGQSYATSILIGKDDKIYLGGYFSDSVSFDTHVVVSSGSYNAFLAKCDLDGIAEWVETGTGNGYDLTKAIASDSSGNIYVAGSFTGIASFGGNQVSSAGGTDLFIAKYDVSGSALWAKRFGTHDDDAATALAWGPGGLVVTGSFADTVDFGGASLIAQGSSDIFILKCTAEGSLVWARQAGGTANGEGAGIALDRFENVYVTGKFYDTIDIGGTPPDCDGIGNIYISKYNSDGVKQWVKCSGAGGEEGGAAIAIDRNENIYVTGGYDNLINLGAGDLLNNGLIDIFIAKYDPSGKAIWSDRAGEAGTDLGTAIATDRNSNLFLAGAFSDTCSFGPFVLLSQRQTDGFVAKIAMESSVHDPPIAADLRVSIYPNPSRSVLNVEYSIPSNRFAVTLEIINILGESVKKYSSPNGKSAFTFTVDDLPAGVYCCRLSSNGVTTSRTVVIQ